MENSPKFTRKWTPEERSNEQTGLLKVGEYQPWPRQTPTKDIKTGTPSLKMKNLNEGAKFDDGKPAFGLLAPELLFGVSEILEYGARKYAARNWEKGISYTRVFGGIMRHMWAWWGGESLDPETGKSHLWHAGCGLMFLIAYEARGMKEFDDRKAS